MISGAKLGERMSRADLDDAEGRAFGCLDAIRNRHAMSSGWPGRSLAAQHSSCDFEVGADSPGERSGSVSGANGTVTAPI
jgi:hypothetical protein